MVELPTTAGVWKVEYVDGGVAAMVYREDLTIYTRENKE